MFFDDNEPEPPDEEQAARGAEVAKDPERQALYALQFDAAARGVAAIGVAFGQSRGNFLSSMADYYDLTRKLHRATVTAQRRRLEKPSCPQVGCTIEGEHEHEVTGPDQAPPGTSG